MYKIKKIDRKVIEICDPLWDIAELAEVALDNWDEKLKEPKMTARVLYSDYGLHVKLTTDEKELVCVQREQNTAVCDDSCMEFFFRPNENAPHYINFEINPFGTMYMSVRTSRADFYFPKEDKKYFGIVSEVGPEEWSVVFTVPFEFIDREIGGHTKTMYGNFQKCGSGEVRHHFTYYPIKTERPDFHRPEYFGPFELE